MGKSTISMAVSNSYVSLPEGISGETLSRILLFSTETILWSNMAAGKSTRDFPPIGNPNIATRLQYFPWSNFVVVFIPILCSKFLKKSLPKMGLPPVIIHCNGIFHHKPSSYWGISYIYISHFMEARPEMRRKKPAPCALSVPCVPWFWAPPPWHSGLLVFTAKLLELLCKLYQIALSGAIQFMIFPFPHPIHDFSLQASLAYDCWAFESAPKKVLVHTNRPQHLATSAWAQGGEARKDIPSGNLT